jgi:uncharacterized protein
VGVRVRVISVATSLRLIFFNFGHLPSLLIPTILVITDCKAASIDCVNPATDVDRAICDDPELGELDDSVASLFASASQELKGSRLGSLQSSQRSWMEARGKCAGVSLVQCLYGRYKRRLLVLEVQYGQGSSTEPLTYVCDQLENEISAAFFKTDPPAVSLKLGDLRKDPVVALLQSSEKGERYVTSDGLVFLANGDDASVTLNDKKTFACHLK